MSERRAGYCLMNYTTQCTDVTTGQTGCFLFDVEHYKATGEFKAISPVCRDRVAFYTWDSANGKQRRSMYIEREATK